MRKAALLRRVTRFMEASDPVGKLQNVVSFCPAPCTTASPSPEFTGYLQQWPFKIVGGRVTHLRLSYFDVGFKAGTYFLPDAGHDITYNQVALACYAATSNVSVDGFQPVTFSGSASKVIVRGDIDILSDVISVQQGFGVPYLEEGDIIWLRQYFNVEGPDNTPALPTSIHRSTTEDAGHGTPINNVFYDAAISPGTVSVVTGPYSTSNISLSGPAGDISDRDPGLGIPSILGYFENGVEPVSVFCFGGQSVWRGDTTQEGALLNYMSKACDDLDIPYMQLAVDQDAGANDYITGNDGLWLSSYAKYANTFIYAMGEDDPTNSTPALREAAKYEIFEYARTTLQMQIIEQNVMPRSTGSWTTDPENNQTVDGAAEVEASAADAIVDTDLTNNYIDYQLALSNLAFADTRRKWSVTTFGGVAAPFTGVSGPLATAGAGREPISINVHNLVMAPSVETLLSTISARWVIDRHTLIDVGTTVATPRFRTNGDDGTAYFILIPDADVAAFDGQTETQKGDDIIAGKQSNGSTNATNAQNVAVSSQGVKTLTQITGLSSNTAYKAYFLHVNAASVRSKVYSQVVTTSNGAAIVDDSDMNKSDSATTLSVALTGSGYGISGYVIQVFDGATTVDEVSVGGMSLSAGTIELVDTHTVTSKTIKTYQTTAAPAIQGPTTCTVTFASAARFSFAVIGVRYGSAADAIRAASINKTNGTGTTPSATAGSAVASDLIIGGGMYVFGNTYEADASQTPVLDFEASAANNAFCDWQPGATDGVMTGTLSASVAWSAIAFACTGAA